jgi:hypothetical protein
MSERHDHSRDYIGKVRIELCAKSFILQVYDVLARHTLSAGDNSRVIPKCAGSRCAGSSGTRSSIDKEAHNANLPNEEAEFRILVFYLIRTKGVQKIPVVLLDRNKTRCYQYRPMMRGARVALVLVAILSITYVLITPDLTDDVDGILRPNHTAKAQRIVSLPLPQTPILVVAPFLLSMPRGAAQRLTTSELFALICVCRC